MPFDHIDFAVQQIARAYARDLQVAKSEFPNDPREAGNRAQRGLTTAIRLQGGTAIKSEPRTGVDSAGGGQSRFDIVFTLNSTDVYLEVQSRDYRGHKPIQLQGQILGFAHVSAGMVVPARYYKILGEPRLISRWSRRAVQSALSRGGYDWQVQTFY